MSIANMIGYIIIGLGALFIVIGTIGILQPGRDFYYRLLVACKVDTVGVITLAIGMAILHGFSFFTGKLIFIVIIMMVLNPLMAHLIAAGAHESGYRPSADCGTGNVPAAEKKDKKGE